MPFKNFSIWRGKLPHWRADDVVYYVTFRHRRALEDIERKILFKLMLMPDGRKWDIAVLSVGLESTDVIFRVRTGMSGKPIEIADIVEPVKRKAGRQIIAKSGERFPPFYVESFDRIIRDEAEFDERLQSIIQAALEGSSEEDPAEVDFLWIGSAIDSTSFS
jgi:hypothetical protein